MTEAKPARLGPIRTEHGVEWLEQHSNGVLFWKADEGRVSASFPVCLEDGVEFMARADRALDVSRLPYPVVANPYL